MLNRQPMTEEQFKEDLQENVEQLSRNAHLLSRSSDVQFAEALCAFYETHDYLTDKQIAYASKFWAELNSKGYL